MYTTLTGEVKNLQNPEILYNFIHSYRHGVKTIFKKLLNNYQGKKNVYAIRYDNKDLMKTLGVTPNEYLIVANEAFNLFKARSKKLNINAKIAEVSLIIDGKNKLCPPGRKKPPSMRRNLYFTETGFHAILTLKKGVVLEHDIFLGKRTTQYAKSLVDRGLVPVFLTYITKSDSIKVAVTFKGKEPNYTPLTVIGMDIGERNIVTLVALDINNPEKPMKGTFINRKIKEIRYRYYLHQKKMMAETKTPRLDLVKKMRYKTKLNYEIHKLAIDVVNYAKQFPSPIIVMEDLTGIRDKFNKGKKLNRRFHSLPFRKIQTAIENCAYKNGIMVAYVDPRYTSQTCHRCGNVNHVNGRTFVCNKCGLKYNRDLNASINIARRFITMINNNNKNSEKDEHGV